MSRDKLIKALVEAKREIEPGQDVEVSLFRPEDALGISIAYFETYGDSFPVDHVYDPNEVIKRNTTADQYNVVARTPKGEIVGLVGLFRNAPNSEVYESGQLMVLKSYRKSNVAENLSRECLGNLVKQLELPVNFVEAVCNHPVSQRLALEQNMIPTGLEIECMPVDAYRKEGRFSRNISLLLMFFVSKKTSPHVCLPHEYAEFIQSLYIDLGLVREFMEGQPLSGQTNKQEFLLPGSKLVRLTVEKAGIDFTSVVEHAESEFGSGALVQVYLNLGDPGVSEAITILNERGYFFGGLLPSWFGTDAIMMQKVSLTPDWDALKLDDNNKVKAIVEFIHMDYLKWQR